MVVVGRSRKLPGVFLAYRVVRVAPEFRHSNACLGGTYTDTPPLLGALSAPGAPIPAKLRRDVEAGDGYSRHSGLGGKGVEREHEGRGTRDVAREWCWRGPGKGFGGGRGLFPRPSIPYLLPPPP